MLFEPKVFVSKLLQEGYTIPDIECRLTEMGYDSEYISDLIQKDKNDFQKQYSHLIQ
jgi:hypothetical protein